MYTLLDLDLVQEGRERRWELQSLPFSAHLTPLSGGPMCCKQTGHSKIIFQGHFSRLSPFKNTAQEIDYVWSTVNSGSRNRHCNNPQS